MCEEFVRVESIMALNFPDVPDVHFYALSTTAYHRWEDFSDYSVSVAEPAENRIHKPVSEDTGTRKNGKSRSRFQAVGTDPTFSPLTRPLPASSSALSR